jgi:polar amino acid transport system permease protein
MPSTTIWDWGLAGEVLPLLLRGFLVTLAATVVGSLVAIVLGLVLAMLRRTPTRWVRVPVRVFVEFVRSTPLFVQLFAVYVVFNTLSPFTIGAVVLGIHYATYMSEVYRAGIDGVPRGQWEAATALSLPRSRVWWAVVLPQAVRNVLPALGNYVISMFKETPFLAVITVHEMVFQATQFGGEKYGYLEAFTLAAAIFLAASYPTSVLVRRLEKRLGH